MKKAKRLIVQMKTKEQLLSDPMAYMDRHGDIWETNARFENWDNSNLSGADYPLSVVCVFCEDFGRLIDFYEEYTVIEDISEDVRLTQMKWGIDKIFTIEEHPEYYI